MTYYSENREQVLQYNINYYWNHIDEKRIYNKKYYESNKENIYINRKIKIKQKIKQDKLITVKFN
jgi:hypothetical protein